MRRRCPRRYRPHEVTDHWPPSLGTTPAPCSQPPGSKAEKSIADCYCKSKERVPLSRLCFGVPLAQHFVQSVFMDTLPLTPQFVEGNLNHLFQFVRSQSRPLPYSPLL